MALLARASWGPCSLRRLVLAFHLAVTFCRADGPLPQHRILQYRVDLEASPGTRYAHVWADFLQQRGHRVIAESYSVFYAWLAKYLPEEFGTPALATASANAWLAALRSSHPDAVEELEAFSAVLLKSKPCEPLFQVPAMAALVSLYPLMNIADVRPSACTSTLASPAPGRVLHGRSLDYEPRDQLAASSVVLDFHESGKLAYRCLHPLPFITATQWFTCIRGGAFSLSVNARSQGNWTEHNTTFQELLRRVASPGSLLLGEVAERAMRAGSYGDALEVLSTSPVISSNYFILAGNGGRGAVVTRFGNQSSANVWGLGSSPGWSDGQLPWMRVQTNVDHWVPQSTGAYATYRRQRAIDELAALGRENVSKDSLMSVYLTDHRMEGTDGRRFPEDVGVILRPTTIASLVLDPSEALEPVPSPQYWRIWAKTPTIWPPVGRNSSSSPGSAGRGAAAALFAV